jgi:phosphoglycolate phosphatase
VKVKPDPTIVEDILRIANVEKKEVLYVGDSGVDMQTAIKLSESTSNKKLKRNHS